MIAFYGASPVLAFNNERYHDFFSESVPLGQPILEYGEENGWEDKLSIPFLRSLSKSTTDKQKVDTAIQRTSDVVAAAAEKVKRAKETAVQKSREQASVVKSSATEKLQEAKERSKELAGPVHAPKEKNLPSSTAETQAEEKEQIPAHIAEVKAEEDTKRPIIQFSEGVEDLVRRAEAALSGTPSVSQIPVVTTDTSSDKVESYVQASNVYTAKLPIGFEPPPGYVRSNPAAPSVPPKPESTATPLPLLAPTVAELGSSEPVIKELASTIDQLTSFLNDHPESAGTAKAVVDAAKVELRELTARFQQIKQSEQEQLAAKLDEQAREYNLKFLELEILAQDKLEEQEQEFKGFYQEEKRRFAAAYREKLENELHAQSEIINERRVLVHSIYSVLLLTALKTQGGGHCPGYRTSTQMDPRGQNSSRTRTRWSAWEARRACCQPQTLRTPHS